MLPLIRLGSIDSTQSFLARRPELGYCGVMADAQTGGRGRGNNAWESERGAGLWLSACLPPPSISGGTILQAAMTAAADVLAPCGIPLGLKWPNDLVAYRLNDENIPESSDINAQRRQFLSLVKIGGIIGEQKEGRVILGLGLNIFSAPDMPERAIPPSSLCALGARNIPALPDLAQSILSAWENIETYQGQRQAAFRWPGPGDSISWEEGCGVCQGWAPDGRLAVLAKSGLVHLASGDVSGIVAD